MKEREISIVDLFVEILLHWRMFIIWMIIGAVAFGALSYVRSSRAAKQQQMSAEEEESIEEFLLEELTEEEIENVNYVIDYEEAYLEQKSFQEGRRVIQLDPEHISKTEATLAVDGGERQRSYDIERVYEDIIVSGEMVEKIAKETGMKISDIKEMFFLNRGGSGGDSLGATEGISTFRISTINGNEAESKKMLETVISFLEEKKPDVEEALGEHEISVVNESSVIMTDRGIVEKQLTVKKDMAAMRGTISSMREALNENEQNYYYYLTGKEKPVEEGEETEDAEEEVEVIITPGVSAKYVVLGIFMAAFIYAFAIMLMYIFNTKIRATDSFQELYGIPQLGVIPQEAEKKKILDVVDRWIKLLRNRNKRQFAPEEALELAAVAAKMAAGKETLQEIALVGCGLKGNSLDMCEKIKVRLKEENIQVNILNNVLYDAQMMEELEGERGVVLVESAGATLYNEIAEELELLKRQDIKVLGGILVG